MSRAPVAIVLAALAMLAAWRIGADGLRAGGATSASASTPAPTAATTLRSSNLPAERARLRARLAVEPLNGPAYAMLAAAAEPRQAEAYYRVAVRRAPRLIAPRVWLANHDLRLRRFDDALRNIDVLLRLAPPYREYLYPRLMRLAADADFADALAALLRSEPAWRPEFMTIAATPEPSGVHAALMAALAGRGAVRPAELDAWIDGLLRDSHWDLAYLHWAHARMGRGARLPAVYNGGFDVPPSGHGFDWHVADTAGVRVDFAETTGTGGLAAHLGFTGRSVSDARLEHPLYLAAGDYRLQARMRAESLRPGEGLQWIVTCGDDDSVLARSEPLAGSFDWRRVTLDIHVPPDGCAGQWLRLGSAAPGGAAQPLSGDVWVDDVAAQAIGTAPRRPRVAVLASGQPMVLKHAGVARALPGAALFEGERVLVLPDAPAQIAYVDGCTQLLPGPGAYAVDPAGCQNRARHAPPPRMAPIEVLPQAEPGPRRPIGR